MEHGKGGVVTLAKWTYKGKTYTSDGKGNTTVVSNSSNRNTGKKSSSSSGGGYGSGQNYGSRETLYTFNDGQNYYSQATRWEDAAKQAGNTSGLKSAVTYNNGTGKGVTTFGGGSGYHGTSPQNENAYNNAMRYEQDILNAILSGNLTFDPVNNMTLGDYGYSGGGSLGYEPFEIGSYESPYSAQIAALMNQLLNRSAFSYDYSTDPIYLQYAQSYNTEGERASQDAMAQAAALTGGLPSSYAVTAANQAGNYYANALNDKIPELYLQNYNMYLDELGLDYNNLNSLMSLDAADYNRWLDNQQLKYQAYRDAVSDSQWDKQFEYGKTLDSYNISQNELDRETEEEERAREWVLYLLEQGINPSDDELAAAGLNSNTAQSLLNSYGYGIIPATYTSTAPRYSSNTSNASYIPLATSNEIPDFSTAQEARQYLKDRGIENADFMTSSEWQRHKNNSSNTGVETMYTTYKDYLKDIVEYYLQG